MEKNCDRAQNPMEEWYKEELAYIHDVGFSDYALKSAPGILEILESHKIRDGLVLDLGCGSGILTQALTKAGYRVLGVDISESMLSIARRRVPDADFILGSLFQIDIPPCNAVISVGECFNYLLDPEGDRAGVVKLCDRIYNGLAAGGLLIFDIAEPGQVSPGSTSQGFKEGEDWIVMFEKSEDREREILTRKIISLRQVGEHYRRDDEVHQQQLYKAADLAAELRKVGFQVEIMRRYGSYKLPPAHAALMARKPV